MLAPLIFHYGTGLSWVSCGFKNKNKHALLITFLKWIKGHLSFFYVKEPQTLLISDLKDKTHPQMLHDCLGLKKQKHSQGSGLLFLLFPSMALIILPNSIMETKRIPDICS